MWIHTVEIEFSSNEENHCAHCARALLATRYPLRSLVKSVESLDTPIGLPCLGPRYVYPEPHWQNIRTTNLIESVIAAVRLKTGSAMR